MEFILSIAEQLDKAATELSIDHSINDRLSLILVDNAVELVVDRFTSLELLSDYGPFRAATAETRKNARSHGLPKRISALIETGTVSNREGAFIVAAHSQRNRLYHQGGDRDPFISALAQVYFRLACDLLVRLDTGFQIWLQDDEMTEIGRRYAAGHLGGLLKLPRIAEQLLDGLPPAPARTLSEQAADAAETARLELAESLRFLLDDNPNRYGAAKLLDLAQRNASREALLQKKGLDGAGQRSPRFQEALAAVRAHDKSFKPQYRAIPHGAWSMSIARIASDPDPLTAFARYDRLSRNMRSLREAIGELAMDLDRYIQSEVDRMRGK